MKAHAQAGGTYKRLQNKPYAGQLRSKAWKCLHGTDPQDPIWVKRCREYWERQGRTYGLTFSNYSIEVERYPDQMVDVLVTFAVVLDVLPGSRV